MKKTLALLLVVCLAFTMVPFMAFAAEEDTTPQVVEPDEYTLVDQLGGFTFADWTAANTSATCTAGSGDVGSFGINASSWGGGSTLTGKEEFFLGNGDFAFSAKVYVRSGNNNTVPGYGAVSFDKMYYSVAVGDLEFKFIGCNTPAILYNGSVIAVGESVITPMYKMNADGSFVLVDGNPEATTDANGTAVYADRIKYREALEKAKLYGSDVILTLAVEGTDVVGKATIGGTETELVRVAKPDGALSSAVFTSVKMYGMNGWNTNYMKGAKLVSKKFITSLTVIDNPLFTTDNWTIVSGLTTSGVANSNVVFAENGSYLRTGTMASGRDIVITYANKTFTGNDFTLTYKAKRRTYMGNDNSASEHFGMRVGDLYFCLNKGGLYPYVEYAGTAVYQSEDPLYTLVGISASGAADIEGKSVSEKCNTWASSYEGSNPTYTISFNNGNLTVKYSSSNFAEKVIVNNIDISAYVTSFIDADVSISNSPASLYTGYDQYSYVNMTTGPVDVGYLNALVGTYADYADYSQYPECFAALKVVYQYLSADKQAFITNYNVIENYDLDYNAYSVLGDFKYGEYLIQNFKSSEWTKVSGGNITFGKLGDISDVIDYANVTSVYTAGTYNLGNEFHLNFTEFHAYYNTTTDTYLGFYVGDLFFKVDLSSSSGGNTNEVFRLYKGSELIASSDTIALPSGSGTSAVSKEFAKNYTAATKNTDTGVYFGGRYNIDYVDGAITVSVNGNTVLTTTVSAVDLTAAVLKLDTKCGWKRFYVYNFNLYATPLSVNLFELNKEIATLANITDFSTYSDLAQKVYYVVDQISETEKSAMYNLGIYEKYNLDYTLYPKNYTYSLVKGFYTSDWKSCINGNTSKISYVRNDTYPTGAIKFGDTNTTYKVVLANELYTSNYFKVSAKHNYYGRDTYLEYTIGELKIRLLNDRSNGTAVSTATTEFLTVEVYMNDVLIYSGSTKAQTEDCTYATLPGSHGENGWYYSVGWSFTYNNGLLTPAYNNGDCSLTAIDLTACEGWDSSYTPNGKEVSFTAFQDWGTGYVTGLNVVGRVNADALEAIDALAVEDVAAAKNIYNTLTSGASSYLSAATNAALKDDFTYTAENATVVYDLAQYRYGDTVTLTATADEGYDFTGWFDADGNLLTADEGYSVTVMPGVSATAKASCLKFSGASLTLQDNLSVNYKVPKSLFDTAGNNYTDPYVVFTLRGNDTTVTDYTVSDDKYVFTFSDIAPQHMNETINATLYANYKDEARSCVAQNYSIKTYCDNTLETYAADDYASLRTLIVDLMNYGAASQMYVGLHTDNLVNASLTEEQAAWGTQGDLRALTNSKDTTTPIEDASVTWKGVGLNLKDSVRMRFKFAADSIDGLTVKVTDGADKVLTISSDAFVPTTDGCYYAYVVGLNAAQMSDAVYVTVYSGETPVSDTICYSIESYAYAKLNSATVDENLNNLLTAMIKYGDSAKAYIS